MDEKTMERIFDPFFTTKEVGKGTGLGLSSVYGIVKQHRGYITVRSAPGQGAVFDVYLPLVDGASRNVVAESVQVGSGSETVLVIEDDANVRNVMTKILSDAGYRALEAADGYKAIDVFKKHKDIIDLVILDVVMPGKNGKEVLDEINDIDARTKAIFVSGYTGDIILEKGVQQDVVDFLQKPVSVTRLLAKVREVLDK